MTDRTPTTAGHIPPLYEARAPLEAEIERLRAAIRLVLDDAESQHPGGWGPDVTTVAFLRAALEEPTP